MVAIQNRNPRFYLLDLSRGLAALGIVIFHLSGNLKPLNALYILVDFFFVLSGFVLFEQIPKTRHISDLKKFFKKRVNRLVPTAWFVIIFSYLIYSIFLTLDLIKPTEKLNINWLTMLTALLFFQFIVPSSAVLLIPMWSLSVEMFMNLLIALIGITWNKLVIIVSITFTLLSLAVYSNSTVNLTSGLVALLRGTFGFCCGLIARIIYNQKISISRNQIIFSSLIFGTVFCLVAWSENFLILVAPTMSVLVYTLSATAVESFRLQAFCTQCGNFSYGVYLWHFPINYFVQILLPAINPENNNYILKILEISLTITFSLAFTWIGLNLLKKIYVFRI